MAEPLQLPRLNTGVIRAGGATSQPAAQQLEDAGPQGGLGQFVNMISSISSPLAQAVVSGVISRELGIQIPTPEEWNNRQLLAQLQADEAHRKLARNQVESTMAFVLDNMQALRNDPAVREAGVTVDESLLERPDEFSRLTQIAYSRGLPIPPMSRGALLLAGVELTTPQESQRKQSEQKLKDRQTFLGNVESVAKSAEQVQLFSEGSGPLAEMVAELRRQQEDVSNVDLSTFDVDSDTAEGARATSDFAHRALTALNVEGGVDRRRAVEMFLKSEDGADLYADQLQGLDTDEQGNHLADARDIGVDRDANFLLTASLVHMAQWAGMPLEEAFRLVGLQGLNQESFVRQAADVASRQGMTTSELLRNLGVRASAIEMAEEQGGP